MSGADRSAAPATGPAIRTWGWLVATATTVAAGILTGCGHAGADHPAASPPRATLTSPAAESQADAVRSLSSEGPVQVVRGARSVVVFNPASGIDAHDLARRVDTAVPLASGLWGTSWPGSVVVLVPGSLAHWQQLTGLPPDPDVAAVSLGASSGGTAQPSRVSSAADGSAGATAAASSSGHASPGASSGFDGGQRIVVDPEAYRRLSDAGRSVVLQHEVEHLVSAMYTPTGMPSWLVEGTADVVGFTGSTIPVPQAAEELAVLVRRSGPPASLPSDASFSGGSSSVAYEEGWLACRLIDREKGAGALRVFYEGVAAAIRDHRGALSGEQRNAIVGSALHQATGWTLADFVTRWQADLQHELGSAA